MFGDINRVELIGNIAHEPELRFTPNGKAVLGFSVATNRKYKADNEWKSVAEFHNVVLWQNAEEANKRMKKGGRIFVEGRLNHRSWDGKDGQKKYKTEIYAERIILLGRFESEDAPVTASEDQSIDPSDIPF